MPILLGFIFLSFLFLFLGTLVILYLRKKKNYLSENQADILPKESTYKFISNSEVQGLKLNEREQLNKDGHLVLLEQIDSIYLIHGTFVGDDPFHIIGLLEKTFPKINKKIISKIKEATKQGQDFVAKDLGNFVEEHESIIEKMANNKVRVFNFTWSSGNHHYARLKGMFDLIIHIGNRHQEKNRILLIGHSHAGQIFALLSQILKNKKLKKQILEIFGDTIDIAKIESSLKVVGLLELDIVTLGTPARYKWDTGRKIRLLHFINHRTKDLLGGTFSGATFTRDGDYIQQWGIAGSDMSSPIPFEKDMNDKLDEVLGVGNNLEILRKNILLRRRLHNQGHHFLVDYGDQRSYPNFLKTIFGHGTYTKIIHLRFHFYHIVQRFYK